MTVSQDGLDLIKGFEGFRSKPYKCPAGAWTIGYGSTAGVTEKTPPITKDQGESLLRSDLARFEKCVLNSVNVATHQYQFDALVSLCYNIGCGAFTRSTLLKKLNAGDYAGAAAQFDAWNKGGGKVLGGLVRRRAAERKMFEGVR